MVSTANALPAALVGLVLADAGAEVWLLEPPSGSRLRPYAPWAFWARGQRSVCVDLKDPAGVDVARELIRRSDVFVDSWAPGVASRLGLAADDLISDNSRLVHARISAFGDDSPWAQLAGWESVVMAVIGGNASFANLAGREGPAFVSTPYCSVSAAHLLLHGILGALVERQRSGVGQQVSTTLAQGMLAHDTWNWLIHVLAQRYGSAFTMSPPYDLQTLVPNTPFFFRLLVGLTKDGTWLQFSQTTERLWAAFLRACDLDPTDPEIHDAPASENAEIRVAFWEKLLAAVRRRTLAEWQAVFDEDPNVWAESFRSGPEVLDHPQLVTERRVVSDGHGLRMPGALCSSTLWAADVLATAPALGEGNDDVAELIRQPVGVTAASAAAENPSPALDGVTVVELGTFYAAPFGATLLAEQGARIIKVEPPEGDPIRNVVPFPELAGIKVLHGKESIELDIGTAQGRAVLHELVRKADVVLQGYRAGVAERLQCTAEHLHAVNPELLYVSAPGYGDGPPCGHRPAFAPTMGAASGMAMRNLGGEVAIPRGADLALPVVKHTAMRLASGAMAIANADGFAGLGVATTTLLGIVGKLRHGRGDHLRSSMLATMAHTLGDTVTESSTGRPAPTPDPQLFGLSPTHRLYPTADGWVMLAVSDDSDRRALTELLEVDVDADDAEKHLATRFLSADASYWQDHLGAAGVTCVKAAETGIELTAMLGEFGAQHGFVTTAQHPAFGEYPRLTQLTRFSRSASVLGESPLCGQHTDAVLAELAGQQVLT
ncbi:CoA transferase [Mycobacterium avium subsp. hominissuis 101]|nr:CoA transferase [Mycobacterium avium subsp. hominissuis 101]